MTRTTLDVDPTVLEALKARSRRERKSLGTVASELLAISLDAVSGPAALRWRSQPMGALVDLEDTEAIQWILDGR